MSISSVNSINFQGKIKETKNGNQYEKYNGGKKSLPLVCAGIAAIPTALIMNSNLLDAIYRLSNSGLPQKSIRLTDKAKVVGLLAGVGALTGLISGLVIDAFVNHRRRKDVDKLVEKNQIKEKTNKGKLIFGGIGVGLGALESIASFMALRYKQVITKEKPIEAISSSANESGLKTVNLLPKVKIETIKRQLTTNEKLSIFSIIPLFLGLSIVPGVIYDHGVNKFRKQLADKFNNNQIPKSKLDEKIDAKIDEKLNKLLAEKS